MQDYPDDPQMDAEPPKNFVKRLYDGDFTKSPTPRLSSDILSAALALLVFLQNSKPNDRSDRDRRYAIAITDTEKLLAYIREYNL